MLMVSLAMMDIGDDRKQAGVEILRFLELFEEDEECVQNARALAWLLFTPLHQDVRMSFCVQCIALGFAVADLSLNFLCVIFAGHNETEECLQIGEESEAFCKSSFGVWQQKKII
jgi:hypothetical protein